MATTTVAVPGANGQGAAKTYAGGYAILEIAGSDFDSGTVTPQISFDGGTTYYTWLDIRAASAAKTANGYSEMYAPEGAKVRMSLSGSSGTTVASATLYYGTTNITSQAQQPED